MPASDCNFMWCTAFPPIKKLPNLDGLGNSLAFNRLRFLHFADDNANY